jgi:hypothetical protein
MSDTFHRETCWLCAKEDSVAQIIHHIPHDENIPFVDFPHTHPIIFPPNMPHFVKESEDETDRCIQYTCLQCTNKIENAVKEVEAKNQHDTKDVTQETAEFRFPNLEQLPLVDARWNLYIRHEFDQYCPGGWFEYGPKDGGICQDL